MKAGETNTAKAHSITVTPPGNVAIVARKDLNSIQMKEFKLKPGNLSSSLLESLKGPSPSFESPRANEQVSSPLVIKGKGEKGATIELNVHSKYNGGEEHLGLFRIKADGQGNWQSVPISLWAPEGAQNLSYSIKAVQFAEGKGASREARLTVKPKQGAVMVMNIKPQLLKANAVVKKPTTIPKLPEKKEDPVNLGPVPDPVIVSPQDYAVLENGRFQIAGMALPNSLVKTDVFVTYFNKRKKEEKIHRMESQADQNGVWRTPTGNFSPPDGAYDIQYTIHSQQVRAEDSKHSNKVRVRLTQKIAPPKLTTFTYTAPDFPSTSAGTIWDAAWGVQYNEKFKLIGKGGPGLKLDIRLDYIRRGNRAPGNKETIEVGPDGNWEWSTSWKYKPDVDTYVILLTLSNPGNEMDQSDRVVEYRSR